MRSASDLSMSMIICVSALLPHLMLGSARASFSDSATGGELGPIEAKLELEGDEERSDSSSLRPDLWCLFLGVFPSEVGEEDAEDEEDEDELGRLPRLP